LVGITKSNNLETLRIKRCYACDVPEFLRKKTLVTDGGAVQGSVGTTVLVGMHAVEVLSLIQGKLHGIIRASSMSGAAMSGAAMRGAAMSGAAMSRATATGAATSLTIESIEHVYSTRHFASVALLTPTTA
jgi:hypothetical protein